MAVESTGSQTLRLVDLQGKEVLRWAIPAHTGVVGAVNGKVALFDGHMLRALAPDGTFTDVEQAPAGATGVFLSPDGAQRLWLTEVPVPNGAQVHSTLSSNGRTIMGGTEEARYLRPSAWTARGVVVEHMSMGIGGYILFDVHSNRFELLDPATGSRRSLGDGTCQFGDLADDGTLACLAYLTTGGRTLEITPTDGIALSVPLPHDRFAQVGAVSFGPGPHAVQLVLGGSPAVGTGGQPEQFETDIVDVRTGAIRQLAVGLRPVGAPWAWLPDGKVLCFAPAEASGRPGVYEVGVDGSRRLITTAAGAPVAVLTG